MDDSLGATVAKLVGSLAVDDSLNANLDRIFAERARETMAPTIAALQEIFQEHPNDARVLYELAVAYDTDGQEAAAADVYERALSAGLERDVRRR